MAFLDWQDGSYTNQSIVKNQLCGIWIPEYIIPIQTVFGKCSQNILAKVEGHLKSAGARSDYKATSNSRQGCKRIIFEKRIIKWSKLNIGWKLQDTEAILLCCCYTKRCQCGFLFSILQHSLLTDTCVLRLDLPLFLLKTGALQCVCVSVLILFLLPPFPCSSILWDEMLSHMASSDHTLSTSLLSGTEMIVMSPLISALPLPQVVLALLTTFTRFSLDLIRHMPWDVWSVHT